MVLVLINGVYFGLKQQKNDLNVFPTIFFKTFEVVMLKMIFELTFAWIWMFKFLIGFMLDITKVRSL